MSGLSEPRFITIWYSAYDFLFDFNRNCASIWYFFQVVASYLSDVANFHLPHLHLAPLLAVTLFAKIYDIRKWRQHNIAC